MEKSTKFQTAITANTEKLQNPKYSVKSGYSGHFSGLVKAGGATKDGFDCNFRWFFRDLPAVTSGQGGRTGSGNVKIFTE